MTGDPANAQPPRGDEIAERAEAFAREGRSARGRTEVHKRSLAQIQRQWKAAAA